MKLTIVIPCYNEEKNVDRIVARLNEALSDRKDIEVVLVDNGSTDHTAQNLANALSVAKDLRMRRCSVPVNQGYGYGIMQGLAIATGDVLAWTHADMQTDPLDAVTAFDAYKEITQNGNADVVMKGKRKNRVFAERFFTFGMQLLASAILGVALDDINAQPKVFSRSFYERFLKLDAPDDFSLDLYLLYLAQKYGLTVKTVPVVFAKRRFGQAKGGGSFKTRLKLIRRTFVYIFELRRKVLAQAKTQAL